MTSKARTSIAVLFGVVMVTRAFGTFGSVISSFKMTGAKPPYARGIYRDSTYVYGVLYGSPCSLRCYTTNGSVVGSVVLSGALFPGDADGTQTGAKYLAVLESKTMVRVYAIATGSFVTSFSSPTTWGYAYYPNNYPPGPSVYYGRGSYVEVYTVGGSFVNSFPVRNPRGLAATYTVGMVSGNYVIVGSAAAAGATRVYTAGGSLRASFTLPFHSLGLEYLRSNSAMASSRRSAIDLSTSTARCFRALRRPSSMRVEKVFFFPMIYILFNFFCNCKYNFLISYNLYFLIF